MVERLGVTQFYGAPTALRLLLKAGDEYVHKYDRSSLRILGCGEGGGGGGGGGEDTRRGVKINNLHQEHMSY